MGRGRGAATTGAPGPAPAPTPFTWLEVKGYRVAHGRRCPWCESEKLEEGNADCEGLHISCDRRCLDCGGRWRERYTLSHIIPLERGGQ